MPHVEFWYLTSLDLQCQSKLRISSEKAVSKFGHFGKFGGHFQKRRLA